MYEQQKLSLQCWKEEALALYREAAGLEAKQAAQEPTSSAPREKDRSSQGRVVAVEAQLARDVESEFKESDLRDGDDAVHDEAQARLEGELRHLAVQLKLCFVQRESLCRLSEKRQQIEELVKEIRLREDKMAHLHRRLAGESSS